MATDEQLDREWQPNGRRPQSTIARSFSQELMDIFKIENSIADLDADVEKRKRDLNSHTSELEAIEARLKAAEDRLRRQQQAKGGPAPLASISASRSPRAPVSGAFDGQTSALPAKDRNRPVPSQGKEASRPGTARAPQQAVPGQLPPTPVASEDGDRDQDRQ